MTIPSESTASAQPASVLRPRAPPPSVLTAIQTLGMDKSLLNTTLRTKAGERRLHQNLFYERMRQRKEEEERRRRQNCFIPLTVVEFMSCGTDKKGGFGCSDGDESIGGQDTKISSLSGLDVVDKEIQRLEAARQQAQALLQESEDQLKMLQKAKTDSCPQQPPPSIAAPPTAMGKHLRSPQSQLCATNGQTPRTSTAEHAQQSSNDNNSKRLFTLERQVINRHEQPYQTLLDSHQRNPNGDDGGPGTVVLDDGIDVTPQVWSPAQQASFQRKNQLYRDLQKPIEESIELLKAPTIIEASETSEEGNEESMSTSILVTVDDQSSEEVEVEIPCAPRPETLQHEDAATGAVVSKAEESNSDPTLVRPSDASRGCRHATVAALVDLDSGCDEASTVVGPMENASMVSPKPDAKVHAEDDAVEVTCDTPSIPSSTKFIRKATTWDAASVHNSIIGTSGVKTVEGLVPFTHTNKGSASDRHFHNKGEQANDVPAPQPKTNEGEPLLSSTKAGVLEETLCAAQPEPRRIQTPVPATNHTVEDDHVSTKPNAEECQRPIPVTTHDVQVRTRDSMQQVKSPRAEEHLRPQSPESKHASPVSQYDVPMVQGFSFNSILSESRVVVKGEPVSPNTVTNRSIARASGAAAASRDGSKTHGHATDRSSSHSLASIQQQRSIRSQRSSRVEETRAAFESPNSPQVETDEKGKAGKVSNNQNSRREPWNHSSEQPRAPPVREPLRVEIDNDEGSLPPSPRHVVDTPRSPYHGVVGSQPCVEEHGGRLHQEHYESRQDESFVPRSPEGIRVGSSMLSQRPKPENLHSPSSKMSAASRLLEHQIHAHQASTRRSSRPKEREFNKLKHLLDQIDYHHHQLHQGAPGSSDEVAGLVVAFGAPKSHSGRSRSSRGQNPVPQPTPALDPPSSSYEVKLRDHHKLCESPPAARSSSRAAQSSSRAAQSPSRAARSSSRVARLETLRRSLEILDDTQPTQPAKSAAPASPPRVSRYPSQGRRRLPLDASPTASPRPPPSSSRPAMLSPTTTDDWDLLMQVRAAILGGETSPIFGSESERVVLWPSK